jgi:hypothetical protein
VVRIIELPKEFEKVAQQRGLMNVIEWEMESISNNQTWILVDLPLNKQPIITKWIFKFKLGIE